MWLVWLYSVCCNQNGVTGNKEKTDPHEEQLRLGRHSTQFLQLHKEKCKLNSVERSLQGSSSNHPVEGNRGGHCLQTLSHQFQSRDRPCHSPIWGTGSWTWLCSCQQCTFTHGFICPPPCVCVCVCVCLSVCCWELNSWFNKLVSTLPLNNTPSFPD